MKNVIESLVQNGVLVISYSVSPKIMSSKYGVDIYIHHIEYVKNLLVKNGLKIIKCEEGEKKSKYVPHNVKVETYNILAVK